MKNVLIFGSTGSIGVNTLKVIDRFKQQFKVRGLTGYSNLRLLEEQIRKYRPEVVVAGNESDALYLRKKYAKRNLKVLSGRSGLIKAAAWPRVDLVVSAMVGSWGLEPTLKAIEKGRNIALANKEVLVMAGAIMMKAARRRGVDILPVDSEHSAIWQCLKHEPAKAINRIILTASGGPFWQLPASALKKVNLENTLKHPTWNMGRKVTIDSATLMNKGFEVIEAHHLFNLPLSKIEVVIHPESVIHSLVEFRDGSILAQLATTDMRVPIQYALSYPERWSNDIGKLDLAKVGTLNFVKPDLGKFPCLSYAYRAAAAGGTLPAVMSASDEIAVENFLAEKISFAQISRIIGRVMGRHRVIANPKIGDILRAAEWARAEAKKMINRTGV